VLVQRADHLSVPALDTGSLFSGLRSSWMGRGLLFTQVFCSGLGRVLGGEVEP
jgi:hypothetical protein